MVLQEFEYLLRENRTMIREYEFKILQNIMRYVTNLKIISLSNHLANLNESICDADTKVVETWSSYKELR